MQNPQIRSVARNRSTRRFSACNRHPSEPVTGFCALCLRDRLAGLDSTSDLDSEKVVVCSRWTRGHVVGSSSPELRRSKSVAAEKCEILTDLDLDPRRNSCDVRARSTLSDLFVVDDTKKLKNLGLSSIAEPSLETKNSSDDDGDDGYREIRVSDDVIARNEIDDDDEVIEGDLKTMKEIIDMELELQNRKSNFLPAGSIFSQKLRKWRLQQKEKKQSRCCINGGTDNSRSKLGQSSQFRDTQSETTADYGFGRRSCDTEPRFSIDTHRLSVEDPRFSLDEHRASWDGYMTARTIPRLTPMLSIVDNRTTNSTMENLQMHSIREDDVKPASVLDSSSSMKIGFGGDDAKSSSNARVSPASDVIFQGTKLVITEQELKDWHLNSIKNNNNNNKNIDSASNAPNLTSETSPMNMMNMKTPSIEQTKKITSSKWKKVCNLWSHKQKLDDKQIPETRVVRNPNCVNSRTRRYSTSDVNSGLLRLYLTPFRNSRRNKSVKIRAPSSMAINGLQLH